MSNASAILSAIPEALPPSSKVLRHVQDAIAALLHSILSSVGFTLIAVDEDASATDYPNNVLPEGWNTRGPSNYTFRYQHSESKSEILLKLSRLGTHVIVNAVAVEASMDRLLVHFLLLTCTSSLIEQHIWTFRSIISCPLQPCFHSIWEVRARRLSIRYLPIWMNLSLNLS